MRRALPVGNQGPTVGGRLGRIVVARVDRRGRLGLARRLGTRGSSPRGSGVASAAGLVASGSLDVSGSGVASAAGLVASGSLDVSGSGVASAAGLVASRLGRRLGRGAGCLGLARRHGLGRRLGRGARRLGLGRRLGRGAGRLRLGRRLGRGGSGLGLARRLGLGRRLGRGARRLAARASPRPRGSSPPARASPRPRGSSPRARASPRPRGSSPPARASPRPRGSSPRARASPRSRGWSPRARASPLPRGLVPAGRTWLSRRRSVTGSRVAWTWGPGTCRACPCLGRRGGASGPRPCGRVPPRRRVWSPRGPRVGRSAVGSGSTAKMWAISGRRDASRAIVERRSGDSLAGSDCGITRRRTGEYARASSTVAQRSCVVSSVSDAAVASASCVATSPGIGAPALGGASSGAAP